MALRHLTDREISDFVRGIVDAQRQTVIREHVSHCRDCADAIVFFEKLWQSAASALTPVPDEVVAEAKSLFRDEVLNRQMQKRFLKEVFPRLVFPLGPDWAASGVRSTAQSGMSKQAVYQWGDIFVDLRSELQSDTERLSLVGQISDQRGSLEAPNDIRIQILDGAKTVNETQCNELGEFTLVYMPARGLCLNIELPRAAVGMKVMLKDLTPQDGIS